MKFQGSGVERRMAELKDAECPDYDSFEDNDYINFEDNERYYFQYSHKEKMLNKPEDFEDDNFIKIFSKYVFRILELIMNDLDKTFLLPL